MITFPNAKINIGLNITGRRQDGYHNIETIFYPVQWCDALEIVSHESKKKSAYTFSASGLKISGSRKNNLCIKAFELMKSWYPVSSIKMHLHKTIPTGAGLGGGSSDASFVLSMLNELFQLNIETEVLQELAGQLGSDCPYFLINKPVFARGKGTEFSEVSNRLKDFYIAIVKPDISINTTVAYSLIKPSLPTVSLLVSYGESHYDWKKLITNDFEKALEMRYPVISFLKNELYKAGAFFSLLSGSGSAVYALFEEKPELPELKKQYPQIFIGKLK